MLDDLKHDSRNSKVEIVSLPSNGEAKQWYPHIVKSMNDDWNDLRDRFHLTFFLISLVVAL
jgi:hypothetical protein